jgi:amphi-Trp domain-containing protein
MEKKKVKIEEKMATATVVERLRKMALDMEMGQIEIQSGDKIISLSVPEAIPLEIEAKRKENKEKLVIEISWRNLLAMEASEEALAKPEVTTEAVSRESACSGETDAPVEEAAGGSSSEALVPEIPTATDSNDAPCDRVTDSLADEAAAVNTSEVTESVIGEIADPAGEPKPRSVRRRR